MPPSPPLPPDAAADGSVTWFFARLRGGDDQALDELWQRFFPRLVGLAHRVLAARPQRAAGAEDVVQDAFVSFWKRARAGEFAADLHRDHLWQLLAQFTVFKARKQVRREHAIKRGGGRVVGESDLPDANQATLLDDLAAQQPADDVDLTAKELLEQIDPELREFAVLRLIGYTTEEIAGRFGCTQRKVQRKLELVRLKWQRLMIEE